MIELAAASSSLCIATTARLRLPQLGLWLGPDVVEERESTATPIPAETAQWREATVESRRNLGQVRQNPQSDSGESYI